MATYTKETALYDTGAIAADIGTAGTTATNYITTVSNNGIKVHDAGDSSNFVHITSAMVDIVTSGISAIKAWVENSVAKVRIGAENSTHVEITNTGMEVHDGSHGVLASFASTGAQIGANDDARLVMDTRSLEFKDYDGDTFFAVTDPRNASGITTLDESYSGTGSQTTFDLSFTAVNTSYTVKVDGVTVSPTKTTTSFTLSSAPADGATIVATYSTESDQVKNYTFGIRGQGTAGGMSVAEGYHTVASGAYSHAFGYETEARGSCSVTMGKGTRSVRNLGTSTRPQLVIGQYNEVKNYPFIIGDGTRDNARSNCFWITMAGDVYGNNTAIFGSSGSWTYKKYRNGKFEAWYNASSTVTLQTALSGASGWYRNSGSPLYQLTVPSGIGSVTVLHADVHAITGLAGMYTTVTAISGGTVTYYVIYSGQLSNRSATITAHVIGTWA